MVITHTTDEIIIRLPKSLNIEDIQRFLNFLSYKENSAKSKATQQDVDDLAKQVNKSWWEGNKHLFEEL